MTSYSQKRSADYVRTYRTMLMDATRPRILPRMPSNAKVYTPASTVSTADATSVFIPLFYAGEKGALGIWDKRVGIGVVKRRLDDEERSFHIMELSNPRTNLGTFISTPKSPLNALHITLPHMVMAMKNYRRNFAFDVLVMDNMAYRRRFCFATWYNPSTLKKFAFMCQIPLRLEIGWNEIHVNFNDLVRSTYRTEYVETIRIQVYANCKLRQIFFCDDRIISGQIPIPSMRDFGNIRLLPLDYGPRTHPDGIESGPEKNRSVPYVDPPSQISPTRLEQDLKLLQRRRFAQIKDQKLYIQPYKTYFRDLIHEQKQRKKVEAALKAELEAKAKKAKFENESKVDNSGIILNSMMGDKGEKVPTLADIRDLLSNDTSFKLTGNEKEINIVKVPAPSPAKPVVVVKPPAQSPTSTEKRTDANANTTKKGGSGQASLSSPTLSNSSLKAKGKLDALNKNTKVATSRTQ